MEMKKRNKDEIVEAGGFAPEPSTRDERGLPTRVPMGPAASRRRIRPDRADLSAGVRRQLSELRDHLATQRRHGRVLGEKGADRYVEALEFYIGAVCQSTGIRLQSITWLEEVVIPAAAARAFASVLDRAQEKDPSISTSNHVYELSRVVAMAADALYAHDDPRRIELHRMKRAQAPAAKTRLTPRKQKSVSVFLDPESAREARELPHTYYGRHDARAYRDRQLATQLTAACGAELLMATSMGPSELAGLTLDDVTEQATPDGRIYLIRTSRRGRPMRYAIGLHSAEVLYSYLTRVRPHRPGAASAALFPGRRGATQNPAALSRSISAFLCLHLEHRIPASDLPDAVAVMLGVASAENEDVARLFLGRLTDQPDPLINTIRTWRSSRHVDDDDDTDTDG